MKRADFFSFFFLQKGKVNIVLNREIFCFYSSLLRFQQSKIALRIQQTYVCTIENVHTIFAKDKRNQKPREK